MLLITDSLQSYKQRNSKIVMETKDENIKVVSPFEFVIAEIADPELAQTMRPETEAEKSVRLDNKFMDFFKKIKINQH